MSPGCASPKVQSLCNSWSDRDQTDVTTWHLPGVCPMPQLFPAQTSHSLETICLPLCFPILLQLNLFPYSHLIPIYFILFPRSFPVHSPFIPPCFPMFSLQNLSELRSSKPAERRCSPASLALLLHAQRHWPSLSGTSPWHATNLCVLTYLCKFCVNSMYLLLMFHMINVYKCYCLPRKSKYRFGVWTNSWTKLATLAVSVLTAQSFSSDG